MNRLKNTFKEMASYSHSAANLTETAVEIIDIFIFVLIILVRIIYKVKGKRKNNARKCH